MHKRVTIVGLPILLTIALFTAHIVARADGRLVNAMGDATSYPSVRQAAPQASAVPSCQLTWQMVDTPDYQPEPLGFYRVAETAANDVWAAVSADNNHNSYALMEHWDGNSWQVVPVAVVTNSILFGVTAISPANAWAVGTNYDSHTTLIEHWDGLQWSVVPNPAPQYSEIQNVTSISANDIWAVGASIVMSGQLGSYQTLTEHWDGQSWSVIPSANVNRPDSLQQNGLSAVAASASNDVWAVGGYSDKSGSLESLIEHWDGSSWSIVPAPPVGVEDYLYAVSARAANDAWVVGGYNGTTALLALHWDGSSWQSVNVPYSGTTTNGLFDVTALAANDVWAVGDYAGRDGNNHTLVEHWDGSTWQQVASPNDQYWDTLYSVAAVSATDIWAVGSSVTFGQSQTGHMTLAMHYTTPPGCPTLTPTNTPTASITPTTTARPSATETATASATPTNTSTPTPLPSMTAIPSPAVSATPCGQSYADVPTEYWANGYIHYLSCRAIVSGYPDGLFHPANNISRAEFSKMLALGYGLALSTLAQPSFTDVTPSYWAYTYIESLHAEGAISGYPDGSFHPNASISRAEMVKMNVLASGVAAYTGALADYPDVPPSYWAYGYIKTATHKQWVGGYPAGQFHPASNASRAELSKVLYLSLSYPRR